jgi:ribonuclease HII
MRTEDEIKIKINETLYTAMVDECGAGPLCGDLVVAAVILDPKNPIVGLNDSKKLTEKKRELLYPQIIEKALDYCIIHISPKEIDKINIFQARMLGMKMAIEGLKRVDYAVIDGNKIPQGLLVEADYVIKGDAKIEGIGAASILAKVTRDRQMEEQAKIYPGYGFEKHKGYGTKVHMDALKELGPCEIHRFSYAPVKEAVR